LQDPAIPWRLFDEEPTEEFEPDMLIDLEGDLPASC
jgi:hypothetical protein